MKKQTKTFYNQPRETHIVDCSEQIFGKAAVQVANYLSGKNKPIYSPNADNGDSVIIKNLEKIQFSGSKLSKKNYYRHSGYIGNLKTLTLEQEWQKNPEKIFTAAVAGMLPKNRLQKDFLKRLSFEKNNG